MSIKAYPKPVITLDEVLFFPVMLSFLPVVTDIAIVAASLSLLSILPDDVTETPEDGSDSTSIDEPLSAIEFEWAG